jgi:hypothetical protein
VSDELWDEQDGDSDGMRAVRAALKKSEKARKEAEDRAAAATKSLGQKTVTDVLAAKNINPKVAGFMPDSLDKGDEAAVVGWLKENADVFGFSLEAETPATPETSVSPEEQEGHDLMQLFQGDSSPAPADKMAKLAALNPADFANNREYRDAIAKVVG